VITIAGIGLALAALLALFGCEEEPIAGRVLPVSGDELGGGLPPRSGDELGGGTSTASPSGQASEVDELCDLQQRMTDVITSVAGSTDPASGDVRSQAVRDFYSAAAGAVDEPDAAAFRAMFEYWEAADQWSETNGGSVDLGALATRPTVPADASLRTTELLEARCGVVPAGDTPGG
jgi:hypothetical protein